MKIKKLLYFLIGSLALVFGSIAWVIPILPTFPFLMLAALCFAKSSKRLNDWFISTKLYKNNIESFARGEGMQKKVKMRIMATITLTISIGFVVTLHIPILSVIIVAVWVGVMLYFIFGIKTIAANKTDDLPKL